MKELHYNGECLAKGDDSVIAHKLAEFTIVEVLSQSQFYVLDINGGPVMARVVIIEVEILEPEGYGI